jgi:nucleoside diphosphate kinase
MSHELAFALINPYSIAKSRTGGIISRFMSRTGLELAAARMFGPSPELARQYADQVRTDESVEPSVRKILASYIERAYAPDPATGRRRRVLLLLFEGENAIEKIRDVAGPIRANMETGETIRDTYGDFILSETGETRYIEPAVLVGSTPEAVKNTLRLWAGRSESDGGLVENASDTSFSQPVEKTLVLIKPDNFKFPSARPGNIIDLFSRSGLRIIGAKVHRMSVAEAERFYGPVRDILRTKLNGMVGGRAARALQAEFNLEIPPDIQQLLGEKLGPHFGDQQFYQILHFMTGQWAQKVEGAERDAPGFQRCLALVYTGPDAVNKIRSILGPTDPTKAAVGSVRKEFGQDIMVNAAHASDSPENALRELGIIRVDKDTLQPLVDKYCHGSSPGGPVRP